MEDTRTHDPDTTDTEGTGNTFEHETEPRPSAEPKPASMKKIAIAVIAAVILLGAGYVYLNGGFEKFSGTQGGDAVAKVNGVEVSREDYDESIFNVSQSAAAQGADVSDPEIKAQIEEEAMTAVVNNVLLLQAATEAGHSANQEDVDNQYLQIETEVGGSEELATRLSEVGLTTDELREDIEKQLTVNEYINAETELDTVAVSDEEIEAFITSLDVPEGTELPPMEEIRPQIESTLISQKQQQIIGDFIAKLRESANIEILI